MSAMSVLFLAAWSIGVPIALIYCPDRNGSRLTCGHGSFEVEVIAQTSAMIETV